MTQYIEGHALVPMSLNNLNRDDTSSPKHGYFFNELHGYISSQCRKRAAKDYFPKQGFLPAQLTNRVPEMIRDNLVAQGWDADKALDEAVRLLTVGGLFDKGAAKMADDERKKAAAAAKKAEREAKKKAAAEAKGVEFVEEVEEIKPPAVPTLGAAAFVNAEQIAAVAAHAGGTPKKADIVAALNKSTTVAQASFGRFFANRDELSIEAAVQVAHSMYLDAYKPVFDYYTALDDYKEAQGQSGAVMLGTKEFISGMLYVHIVVDVDQLERNLPEGTDIPAVVQGIIEALLLAQPKGMQKGTAAGTVPDYVLIVAHDTVPVNLSTAFFRGTTARRNGWTATEAITALNAEFERKQQFQVRPAHTTVSLVGKGLTTDPTPNPVENLPALLDVVDEITQKALV